MLMPLAMTPVAGQTWDDLAMYVEALSPLDSEYIEQEVKRITHLIAGDPSHTSLKRTRFEVEGYAFYLEIIRTSSYVDHDVAICWTLAADNTPVLIGFALKYLR